MSKKKPVKIASYPNEKILIPESIMNCLPTILGLIIWGGMFLLGVSYIQSQFNNSAAYPLVVITFLIVIALPMTRIIPQPSLVYDEGFMKE